MNAGCLTDVHDLPVAVKHHRDDDDNDGVYVNDDYGRKDVI